MGSPRWDGVTSLWRAGSPRQSTPSTPQREADAAVPLPPPLDLDAPSSGGAEESATSPGDLPPVTTSLRRASGATNQEKLESTSMDDSLKPISRRASFKSPDPDLQQEVPRELAQQQQPAACSETPVDSGTPRSILRRPSVAKCEPEPEVVQAV